MVTKLIETDFFFQISTFLEERKTFEAERENLESENERLKKMESDLKDSATTTMKSNSKGRNLQVILFFNFIQ